MFRKIHFNTAKISFLSFLKKINSFSFLISKVLLFLSLKSIAGHPGSIHLDPLITKQLNGVLRSTEDFHKSLYINDKKMIESTLRNLIVDLSHTARLTENVEAQVRAHLTRILFAVKVKLELTQTSSGERRVKNIQEAFEQLAHLPRIYALDSRYKIYFCSQDKSSWVQTGLQAQNPIHPSTLGHCGKVVE